MILVTVGSQKFQFNRLLKKIDELIEKKIIEEEVFAQIGVSDYKPKKYEYIDFLSQDDFYSKMRESRLVITHGGTGAIISALKLNKKVIAVPRLSTYKEHVDDHQIQLIKEFTTMKFIQSVYNIDELDKIIKEIDSLEFSKYVSNTDRILESINEFLEG